MASHTLLRGVPVALVDGTNRFDAYYIAEFARLRAETTQKDFGLPASGNPMRQAGVQARKMTSQRFVKQRVTPEQLLQRIHIARAFTCYQMEATITERLPAFLKRTGAPIAIIFGLLDTFYDEQAPLFEVKAGVERIVAALYRLKTDNISVLLASLDMKLESKERNGLFPRVSQEMDGVFAMEEGEHGIRLTQEPVLQLKGRTRNKE
jgi:hypothetical protein